MRQLFDKGIFTISIDVELAWGMVDMPMTSQDYAAVDREREVVRRLLDLFSTYNVRATWALVGHLLLDCVAEQGGTPLPDFPRPAAADEADWFAHVRDAQRHAWCARDIVDMLRRATPAQEIGSHSFAHLRFDEQRTRRAAIEADIAAFTRLHADEHLPVASFIFPYNCVGFRSLLAQAGVRAYRGVSPRWYDGVRPNALRRVLNLLTVALALPPRTVLPAREPNGLVNIPDSMLWYSRRGMRRWLPPRAQVRMAQAGLDGAARHQRIFHLWFHPSNFAFDTDRHLAQFEDVLRHAQQLTKAGTLTILTMHDITRRLHDTAQ